MDGKLLRETSRVGGILAKRILIRIFDKNGLSRSNTEPKDETKLQRRFRGSHLNFGQGQMFCQCLPLCLFIEMIIHIESPPTGKIGDNLCIRVYTDSNILLLIE